MPKHHFANKQSKRVSTRKRTKIERKVREHNRKVRKDDKKGATSKNRKKKDPGVPNSFPFKEQVLKEAEERKIKKEEERQNQKDQRKKNKQSLLDKKRNLHTFIKDAEQRSANFNKNVEGQQHLVNEKLSDTCNENSLKAYYKEFRKVVEAADVVIQVLDARDPLGSRCKELEDTVLSSGSHKRLLLLLNKIDLVPKENVENWLKYLRNEFPAIAFKASTQEQSGNLSRSKLSVEKASEDLRQSSKCLGADTLMKLLSNYCRNKDIKTSITVGVVGFPNTGKSSIINSLKRNKACSVGAMPGVTKNMQAVTLDKHIKLLDSPGIVIPTGSTDSQVILRNCVKIEAIVDPIPPVEAILRRCSKQKMMLKYNIADFGDVQEFLAFLAIRMGKLKKGGIPDSMKAAKKVLQDWNSGKLRYYTEPPETQTMSTHLDAQIISTMSKEFDIDNIVTEELDVLNDLKSVMTTDMVVESCGEMSGHVSHEPQDGQLNKENITEDMDNEESDVDMEGDSNPELKNVVIPGDKQKKIVPANKKLQPKKKGTQEMELEGNLQLHKQKRQNLKKQKRKRKKTDKLSTKLSDALEGAMSGLGSTGTKTENYDFGVDFK